MLLQKNMPKLVKSPQGLTDLNFNWMTNNLVEDGIFSERQAEVLNHKAVEYNLPVKTPDERVIEDSVRPGEERFKVSGTFVNIVESDTKSDTQGHITSYHFDKDGKLHVQSNEIVDLKGLMPPLVQKQDGSYRCGAATGAERARRYQSGKIHAAGICYRTRCLSRFAAKKGKRVILGSS